MPFAIQCPSCKRKLKVSDKVAGKRVKCPGCGEGFLAAVPEPDFVEPEVVETEAVAVPVEDDDEEDKPRRRPRNEDDERVSAKPPRRRPRDDDEERVSSKSPARRRSSRDDDDDEDDDRESRRRRSRDDDDEDDDRPRRRRRRDGDSDDDIRIRRRQKPHRGGLILALGIIAMVVWCCPLTGWIMGGITLSMANTDLIAMNSGHMDDSGYGLTMTGKICAIVAVLLATLNAIAGAILRITNAVQF